MPIVSHTDLLRVKVGSIKPTYAHKEAILPHRERFAVEVLR